MVLQSQASGIGPLGYRLMRSPESRIEEQSQVNVWPFSEDQEKIPSVLRHSNLRIGVCRTFYDARASVHGFTEMGAITERIWESIIIVSLSGAVYVKAPSFRLLTPHFL